jgi:hypothetical protein
MELHHIDEKAKGGPNTFENCIPLCFECHADVGHYNDDHPKGTKYSPKELLAHRDNWYEKVKQTDSPDYDNALRKIDERIATDIHSRMMVGGGYFFLKEHSLWAPYKPEQTDSIYSLARLLNLPDYEFRDAQLENERANFTQLLQLCASTIAGLTGPSSGTSALYNVCSDLEFSGLPPNRQDEIKEEIEEADAINTLAAEAYETLYRLVRERLYLDLRFEYL